jgi:hypothetical protein
MMNVITLNLLAEEQLAEEASARDPVKTAVAIVALTLMCFVMAGSVLWIFASQKKAVASALQTKWDAASSKNAGSDFKTIKAQADDIMDIETGRTLFAPQLALIKDVVPESVQLIRVSFTLRTETKEPAVAAADNPKASRAARPRLVQFFVLQLDGRATSIRPEIEADDFLQLLQSSADLKASVERVQLRSIARISSSGDTGETPSAAFVIECQYKERS